MWVPFCGRCHPLKALPDAILTALLILVLGTKHLAADLRCYCNDSSCVATGYMCKSTSGCYTQLAFDNSHPKSRHGCIESLPSRERDACQGEGDIVRTRPGQRDFPVLICCGDDMCNYVNSGKEGLDTPGRNLKGQENGSSDEVNRHGPSSPEGSISQGDLWFKAAVIAVPISGGFILVLLVLLAVRMLKSDSRRHKRLMQMRQHRSLTKAQLYVADHFCDKQPVVKQCDHHHHHLHHHSDKPNNVYRDVNIKIEPHGKCFEKWTDPPSEPSQNSVIIWGDPTRTAANGTTV